jgi:hypothetical protein
MLFFRILWLYDLITCLHRTKYINIMFINILNAFFTYLLYNLVNVSVNAIHLHVFTSFQAKDIEITVDISSDVCMKLSFKLILLIIMQTINRNSLIMSWFTLVSKVFVESDCKDNTLSNSFDKILVYSQNMTFEEDNIYDTKKFKSFWLSRFLQDQEQLNLNRSDQDEDQSQVWSCEKYITNFRTETKSDCHNISNEETTECIRLWHYQISIQWQSLNNRIHRNFSRLKTLWS